jgi:hypothetical protein
MPFLKSRKVRDLLVEYVPEAQLPSLTLFLKNMKEQTYLFLNPVYQRMFSEKTKLFIQSFREHVFNYRDQRITTESYEQMWTMNSMGNFVHVLETPSVFHLKGDMFRGKPAILAAAGPSLQEEFERLKYIKENGLAYIFSVGSANKALLANSIKPDAVTTYDPTSYNYYVFEQFYEQAIDDVPMIFGSSVGYKVLFDFPGPRLHMITNQDTIAQNLLKEEQLPQRDEIIHDAPTITILTLEMVYKLGFNPIILVGQNFGYKNDQYYAQGISYSYRPTELQEHEKSDLLEVEGADGGFIKTTASHNLGRFQMEHCLSLWPQLNVINATKGGAKIKGAEYKPLEEIIEDGLKEKVVLPDWHLQINRSYNFASVKGQADKLHDQYVQFPKVFESMEKDIRKLNLLVNYNESAQIRRMFPKLDNHMKDFLRNGYFDTVIRPMLRTQFDLLDKELLDIRRMTDPVEKAKKVVTIFGGLIYQAHEMFLKVNSIYSHLHQYIVATEPEQSKSAVPIENT